VTGTPRDWPLHAEIQDAKRRLAEAPTWEEKLDALAEVERLCRRRNALMEDMDVLEATGEALVL
jgi:hypothetical protein